jgi:TonB family protein
MGQKDRYIGSFKLCIDTSGAVARIETVKATGFEAFDQKLIRSMRQWQYRPYEVDGAPASVCTMITFVYDQTPR